MPDAGPSLVLLARERASSRIVYHHLRKHCEVRGVIIEKAPPRRRRLKQRLERFGLATVAGQALLQLIVVPLLRRSSRARIAQIKTSCGLDDRPIDEVLVTRVPSVNSEAARELLRALEPEVVVINGTRIVSGETLAALPVTFLNVHAGITPRYRGVHGGYWALHEGDVEHCGVTVHVVDEGLDTGPILAQARIDPIRADNLVTYPLLQLAVGLPLLTDVIERVAAGAARAVEPPPGPSTLWFHPTARQYLAARVKRGVT